MTTTYGTIPTSLSPSSNIEFFSRAKDRINSNLSARRHWKETLDLKTLALPSSFRDALNRVRSNTAYFRTNYVILVLLILFLSLLWHPISLIVFVTMMSVWMFAYFLRDDRLSIFGCKIDDRVVLVALSAVTLVLLFLTKAKVNVVVAMAIGVAVVVMHAVFRRVDDLFVEDEESAARLSLKNTASDSLSS